MEQNIRIEPILWGTPAYDLELALRQRIMRAPIGLSVYDEDLEAERDLDHFGAYQGDDLLGIIFLQPVPERTREKTAIVRILAVDTQRQRSGVGRMLLEHAEGFLAGKGYQRLILHARVTAQGFYAKLGYQVTSEEFEEVGLPHILMEKPLA